MTAAQNWIVDSETVRLRLPENEEDLNWVRNVYTRNYWKEGAEILPRLAWAADRAISKLFTDEMPSYNSGKHRWLWRAVRAAIKETVVPPDCCRADEAEYQSGIQSRIEAIVKEAEIWLACSPADPWFLMGFAIIVRAPSGILLHYLYVKKTFRRIGLGTKLLEAVAGVNRHVLATHMTQDWMRFAPAMEKSGFRIEFNPHLAGVPNGTE